MALEGMFRLSHNKLISLRDPGSCRKVIRRGKWFAAFLLAVGSAFGSPGGHARAFLLASPLENLAASIPVSLFSPGSGTQSVTSKGEGVETSDARVEAIQAAIQHVHTPSLQALATALGLSAEQIGRRPFEDSEIGIEPISVIRGSGVPEAVVKWRPPAQVGEAQPEVEPDLYLLSWDRKAWQASFLTPALDALTVRVLPGTESTTPLIAVVLFRGMTAVPYPVIFRFADHHASLVWDGRKPASLYSGYDYGSIQFEKAENAEVPVMLATGLADPGLLVFPSSSERNRRGFQVVTAYAWQDDAYVAFRTEYSHTRDYTLYRFISALHLRDFKTAYSLIEPKQFLKTDKPSLKLFHESVLKAWPEFVDDRIFEVPSAPERNSESHIFVLKLNDKKTYVYHPTFTSGPPYLLTGLTRTETSE